MGWATKYHTSSIVNTSDPEQIKSILSMKGCKTHITRSRNLAGRSRNSWTSVKEPHTFWLPRCFLVGGIPNPLKNISQLGWLFPIYGKIKNVPNHQPVSSCLVPLVPTFRNKTLGTYTVLCLSEDGASLWKCSTDSHHCSQKRSFLGGTQILRRTHLQQQWSKQHVSSMDQPRKNPWFLRPDVCSLHGLFFLCVSILYIKIMYHPAIKRRFGCSTQLRDNKKWIVDIEAKKIIHP